MLIRVKSAAPNPSDSKILSRLVLIPYLRWVLPQSPAFDVSGVVIETNCPVNFPLGSRVFGNGLGGLQKYSVVFCNRAGKIPPKVSFNNAAASITPVYSAFAAMERIPKSGETVVILGATGACGQAAIGTFNMRNVRNVICFTAATHKEDFLFAKGCTQVYSNALELLEAWSGRVDLVLDTESSFWHNPYFPTLHALVKSEGKYVSPHLIFDQFVPWRRNPKLEIMSPASNPALAEHIKLMESSTLQIFNWVDIVHIFNGFNLTQVSQGFSLVLSARGKIVFEME